MKNLLKLIVALALLVWGVVAAVQRALPVWLQDIVALQAPVLTGSAAGVEHAAVDWRQRVVSYSGVRIDNPTVFPQDFPLARVATLAVVLPADFEPDWHRDSLLPAVLPIESLTLDDVLLDYDMDTEAGNLRNVRERINRAAVEGMRQRLNASGNVDAVMPQLVDVKQLRISGIQVNAHGESRPERQKKFLLPDVILENPGAGAVTPAEIVDVATRALMDSVQVQALAQGVVEPPKVEDETRGGVRQRTVRRSAADDEGFQQQEQPQSEGKGKKFFKEVGSGFKQVGKGIGNLFKRDK